MSKQTQQFFEQVKNGESPSLVERLQQAASTAKGIAGQMWDDAKPMFDHGRTELAAALFAGHAHVMYMKGQEGLDNGPEPEKEQATQSPQREQGGREM
jgi:hypothetical protein